MMRGDHIRGAFLPVLLLTALISAIIPVSIAAQNGPDQLIGKPAPDLTLRDLSGKEIRLSQFKGKPVFLEFWATWCPYCLEVLPGVEKIHTEFKSRGVEVIAVSIDTKQEAIAPFLKKNGYTMPVLVGDGNTLKKFNTKVIPTVFLIDRNGTVQKYFVNYGKKGQPLVEAELKKLVEN